MRFFLWMYCRTFQIVLRIALPFLPYRVPRIVDSCQDLDNVLLSEKIGSVLIVTDEGVRRNGLTWPVEMVLRKCHIAYGVYDRIRPNPAVDNVEEALAMYKKLGCEEIIAVGGGSSMDCAKVLGARVAYPHKTIGQMKGILRVLRRLPVMIAVPTAGTGSEVTLAAVITEPEKCHKYALMSFPLIPKYAVLDPALTYSLPPHLTATTGMDVLTHAVEASCARCGKADLREYRNGLRGW